MHARYHSCTRALAHTRSDHKKIVIQLPFWGVVWIMSRSCACRVRLPEQMSVHSFKLFVTGASLSLSLSLSLSPSKLTAPLFKSQSQNNLLSTYFDLSGPVVYLPGRPTQYSVLWHMQTCFSYVGTNMLLRSSDNNNFYDMSNKAPLLILRYLCKYDQALKDDSATVCKLS